MDAYKLLQDKVLYNLWANEQLVNWLRIHSIEILERSVVSSFSSIRLLLLHISEAQQYYLSILQKTQAVYNRDISNDKLLNHLIDCDRRLAEWYANQNSETLEVEVYLKRSPFVETYTIATIIAHMLNHATYHRGQLVAMRHQLQMETPPKTDYYRYFIYLQTGKNP